MLFTTLKLNRDKGTCYLAQYKNIINASLFILLFMTLQINAKDSFDQYRPDNVDDKKWSSLKALVEDVKLLPSAGGGIDHRFGTSVSVSGNRMVVGAPRYSLNSIKHGAVYVFDFDGNKWNESQILTPFDGEENDEFGTSVSLSGNRLLIGAPRDNNSTGTVFIYDFDGVSWLFTEKLHANDGGVGDKFGISVSLDGNRALIGASAFFNDDLGLESGAAYIFELNNNVWSQTEMLLASDASSFIFDIKFGTSVSLLGTRALIGSESGTAYLFDFDGNDWLETTILTVADTSDSFGRSVSLTNNRALIGSAGHNSSAGAAYIFDFDNNTWSQSKKLQANDAESFANFGYSVNIIGNRALISAVFESENGPASGAAYVFDFDGNTWTQSQKFTAIDATTGDEFGFSVSLTNDRLIIGARYDDSNGDNSGSVYVFDHNGSSWNQSHKVLAVAGNGAADDFFGTSVSIDGNRALIGAPGDADNGPDSGAAYLFDFDGNNWNQTQKVTADDASAGDEFGSSVSLFDDRALIGASGVISNKGAAYLFDFDGNSWNQTKKTIASDGIAGDYFGGSVSLSGNRALIGAYGYGTAYFFDFNGSNWTQSQQIFPDGTAGDNFGYSVSLFGNRALIGANENDQFSGAAYLFDFDGSNWNQTQKIVAKDADIDDQFGDSVSLSGDRVLIGASGDDENGNAAGAAYLFDFNGNSWHQTEKITANDAGTDDVFGSSVSLSGNRALIGASGGGAAYLFDFDGSNWSQNQKIIAADGETGDVFGSSVSLSGTGALIGAIGNDDRGDDSGAAYIFTTPSDLIFKNSFEN